jgi:hypothetical protein
MREHPRINGLRKIAVRYEGKREEIAIRPPDISARGMFINTDRKFPECAVLKLRFRLATSGVEIETRSEVRYCLPGVGVGVEFIELPQEAARAIEKEVQIGTARAMKKKRHGKK